MTDVFQELSERGFLHNTTGLHLIRDLGAEHKLTAYIGFDLTAPSLHVGSLIQLIVLRKLAAAGHNVIALLGEATTRIGDPSMRDTSRPMLDDATIAANRAGIEAVIRRIVPQAQIRSNMEWFGEDMSFLTFLREFGPHFTINRMNTFETVKRRLDAQQPMTFLEFTYMLLQAVDFLKLNEQDGCTLQIGGSDQWGNIINGVELIRRVHGDEAFGMTTVLLTDSQGRKMGKTADGAVWLSADMFSPFDFFQFWRNVEDTRVRDLMLLFTDMSKKDINKVIAANINDAKHILATFVTQLVHGDEETAKAIELTHRVFREGEPQFDVMPEPFESLSALIHRIGWAESRGAARRLMQGGAVSLDGTKVLEDQPASSGGMLRVGKKKVAQVTATSS